jgi:RNA polymerase sigma factor (TIGR02999 family)
METNRTVSHLLHACGRGNLQARDDLLSLVYRELRQRAAQYLRHERRNHTLQPTALVHEAYIRLVGQKRVAWQNRAHFFGVAAQMMRHPCRPCAGAPGCKTSRRGVESHIG